MGFNFFVHGIVRIPKLEGFSQWMAGMFAESLLPLALVKPFAYVLPFVELSIGVLLIVGFQTRKALNAGALVILMLVSGSCLIEKWDMAGGQMTYAIYFFALSYLVHLNAYSVDARLGLKK